MSQETAMPAEMTAEPVKPLVYGYVRTAGQNLDELADCEVAIAEWCQREGWQLGNIFRDVGVSADVLIRPGLTAAVDVLQLPDSYALVVLDAGHLSSLGTVAKTLRSAIWRTGKKLWVKGLNGKANASPTPDTDAGTV